MFESVLPLPVRERIVKSCGCRGASGSSPAGNDSMCERNAGAIGIIILRQVFEVTKRTSFLSGSTFAQDSHACHKSLAPHSEARGSSSTCWQKKFIKWSSLGGDQLRLHKVVESSLKTTPGGAERARGNDFFEQMRIECAEPWSENAAVGLGEQHGDWAAKVC